MVLKFLIASTALSSLIGYLEWGDQGDHALLYQVEIEFISKLFTDPRVVLHPFTVIPLAGQLVLIFVLFQKPPNFWLFVSGISGLALLFLFMLFIGMSSGNWKITISVLPFVLLSLTVILLRKKIFV
ncbi:MAG: hypothetical protein JNJ99_05835 [Crocinitomicaceae bacterium]|nr:hypothetical protein [Crocinitomicaceae bacterium]